MGEKIRVWVWTDNVLFADYLELVLKAQGLEKIGSGFNFVTNRRDIQFEAGEDSGFLKFLNRANGKDIKKEVV